MYVYYDKKKDIKNKLVFKSLWFYWLKRPLLFLEEYEY